MVSHSPSELIQIPRSHEKISRNNEKISKLSIDNNSSFETQLISNTLSSEIKCISCLFATEVLRKRYV